MVVVSIAHVSAYYFISSLALEAVLYVVGAEAPNGFARNNAEEHVIMATNVGRGSASSKVAPAKSGASAGSAAITTARLGSSVARRALRVARH